MFQTFATTVLLLGLQEKAVVPLNRSVVPKVLLTIRIVGGRDWSWGGCPDDAAAIMVLQVPSALLMCLVHPGSLLEGLERPAASLKANHPEDQIILKAKRALF